MDIITMHLVFIKYVCEYKDFIIKIKYISSFWPYWLRQRFWTPDSGAKNFTILVEVYMDIITIHLGFILHWKMVWI